MKTVTTLLITCLFIANGATSQTIKKIYTHSPGFVNFLKWEEHDKLEFVKENERFYNTFNVNKDSYSFKIPINQLYTDMLSVLEIQKEVDDNGDSNCVRIYPALDKNIWPWRDEIFLILVGEKKRLKDGKRESILEYDKMWLLKDGRLTKTTIDMELKIKERVTNYQKLLNTTFKDELDYNLRSFSFTISELKNIVLDNYKISYESATADQGIIMFPCIEDATNLKLRKTFFLVTKGYDKNGTLEGSDYAYFDNMDGCPDKCPELEIIPVVAINKNK